MQSQSTFQFDFAVIGAGIVGLSTAHFLAKKRPCAKIVILDKEDGAAKHQTGRNSGVIHAGIYYAPGSAKARLCKRGSLLTRAFCEENSVPFDLCGKLIVATDRSEFAALEVLEARSRDNGLNVRVIDTDELREIEPNVVGERALLSTSSGIVNYGQICTVLVDKLKALGVEFRFGQAVVDLKEETDAVGVETCEDYIEAKYIVACAGLQADRIAALSGLARDFRIIPFRGEYFRLAADADINLQHLIYPVPDPSLPFLGVHLTKMIEGYTTVGPNAMFSLGRETYAKNVPNLSDLNDSLGFPGFWKMLVQNIRPGFYELQGSLSKSTYLKRCQKYCPSLKLSDFEPHPPGIRAQAVGRDGRLIDDFLLRETARSIHVCNAPSPAATSAFSIAEIIGQSVLKKAA